MQILCPSSPKDQYGKSNNGDSAQSDNSIPGGAKVEDQDSVLWKRSANVLDRCFFLIFVILVAVVYGVWFPSREKLINQA